MGSHAQKGHGKKRPRRFHHGRAEGRKAVPVLDQIDGAERRGRSVAAQLQSVAARYREDIILLEQVARSAPFVPRLEAGL